MRNATDLRARFMAAILRLRKRMCSLILFNLIVISLTSKQDWHKSTVHGVCICLGLSIIRADTYSLYFPKHKFFSN